MSMSKCRKCESGFGESTENVVRCATCKSMFHVFCAGFKSDTTDKSRWTCKCCTIGCCSTACIPTHSDMFAEYVQSPAYEEHLAWGHEPGKMIQHLFEQSDDIPPQQRPFYQQMDYHHAQVHYQQPENPLQFQLASAMQHYNPGVPATAAANGGDGNTWQEPLQDGVNPANLPCIVKLYNGYEVSPSVVSMRNWQKNNRMDKVQPSGEASSSNNNNNNNKSTRVYTAEEIHAHEDKLEQNYRLRNAIIRGVPVKDNENLHSIVRRIGQCFGMDLANKICAVWRRGKAWSYDGIKRPIEASFYCVMDKRMFIQKRLQMRSFSTADIGFEEDRIIYVNESLTSERFKLFGMTKNVAREKGYHYVWVQDGVVCIKLTKRSPVYRILSEKDLRDIM